MIKAYYSLAKPGIIYGNAITATAGFLLASKGVIDFGLLTAMLVGLSFVIGSGAVVNNYLDRDMDAKMERTKNRALVIRKISDRNALIYAAVLGVFGFVVLIKYTNLLTAAIALVGVIVYLGLYTVLKPRSVYAAIVGSIAGAVPPVIGYTVVTQSIDMAAIILFLILVLWQIPHFYAIAIYRLDDYVSAGIPVLPAKKGIAVTKIHILIYIHAFIIAALLLVLFGFTGLVYTAVMLLFGLTWLGFAFAGFAAKDDRRWARKMFLFSLVVLIVFSMVISVESVL